MVSTEKPRGESPVGDAERNDPARQRFGSKGWQVTLVWVVCIGVVAGIVAAFGGFGTRTDKGVAAQPGDAVMINAAEVWVRNASANNAQGSYAVITIEADVRNTSGQPLSALDLEAAIQFGYVNGESTQVRTGYSSMFIRDSRDSDQSSPRQVIPPTDEIFPVTFTVSVTDGFDPGRGISVALFPVVYKQNTVLGLSDQKYWVEDEDADHYWIVMLPLT